MDGNGSAARFPLPSEIADAPGAEDWRSMYPYFTRFQPERRICRLRGRLETGSRFTRDTRVSGGN
jgi:hypothetical protein